MSYINQITLQGNLGKDAETKHTPDGTPVTTFSMATETATRKGPHVDWHDIVIFGELAEEAGSLRKGDNVRVEGTLRSRTYEKDGANRKVWEVRASAFEKMERSARKAEPEGVPA